MKYITLIERLKVYSTLCIIAFTIILLTERCISLIIIHKNGKQPPETEQNNKFKHNENSKASGNGANHTKRPRSNTN